MSRVLKIVLLMAALMLTGQANAANWIIGAGLTFGGDELGGTTADTVDAGELFRYYAGVQLPLGESPIVMQLTAGYHEDTVFSSDGAGTFDRFELEVLTFYTLEKFRLGIGLTQHTSVEFDTPSGFTDYKFDDTTGTVIEAGYLFGRVKRIWLNVRLADIEYQSPSTIDVDGSYIGFSGTYMF